MRRTLIAAISFGLIFAFAHIVSAQASEIKPSEIFLIYSGPTVVN